MSQGLVVDGTERATLLQKALAASTSAVTIVDVAAPDQPLVYVNRAFTELTGYAPDEAIGRNCRFLQGDERGQPERDALRAAIASGRAVQVVLRNYRKDGSAFWNELQLAPIFDDAGRLTHYVGFQHDVSERVQRDCEVRRLLGHDCATGLAGRGLIEDRLTQSLARHEVTGDRPALIVADLEVPGRALSPAQLEAVARACAHRILGALPANASAARLGPLKFGIVLDPLESANAAATLAAGLKSELSLRIGADEPPLAPRCGIGIAVGIDDGPDAITLLRAAELTAAQARAASDRRVRFHGARLDTRLARRTELERDLLRALDNGEFHLVYQPQVSLETSTICGFEALLRWTHPEYGPLPPSEFIPTAEAAGLIVPISEWVLRTAWRQLAAWERAGHAGLRMAVNVSPAQLKSDSLDRFLRELLAGSPVDPAQLEIELTERLLTEAGDDVRGRVDRIKALGVRLAIDDFGTGYSNLSFLSRLPVDCIKIDYGFTHNVTRSPAEAAICRMICELARALQLRVVAEGIESEGQLEFFARLPCHEAQGFLLSKPLPAAEATALLESDARLGTRARADGARRPEPGSAVDAFCRLPPGLAAPRAGDAVCRVSLRRDRRNAPARQAADHVVAVDAGCGRDRSFSS